MRSVLAILSGFGILTSVVAANAAECPGNPNALGTSRVIAVDPTEHARLGTMQYGETLPLADHEVVITFDDGPLPPYSNRVLATLESECVKATYFIVGSMARAYPDVVKKIHAAGHTIGTHSQHHPMTFNRMPIARAQSEIEDGIASTAVALGNPKALAPFFRIPGFARSNAVEDYVEGRGLMLWSADFPADDWKHISANEIVNRAIRRIEAKGRGILLLHDIQPATAAALPTLLHELKARGYRIVHVVPASVEQPKTATAPQDWKLGRSRATVSHVAKPPARHSRSTPLPLPLSGVGHSVPEPQIIDLPSDTAKPEPASTTESIPPLRTKRKARLMLPTAPAPLILSN
jgi:peptidoglycan-N-acetylglucosamine deacetylase